MGRWDKGERGRWRAQHSGELCTEHDPKALARFLVNSIHGLRVLARSGADPQMLEDAARLTLEVLR